VGSVSEVGLAVGTDTVWAGSHLAVELEAAGFVRVLVLDSP
jgi:hypothetical protein